MEHEEHCHYDRGSFTQRNKKAKRKLIIASILCVLFMTAEIVGGVLSGSLAIATDAAHLLTDLAAFMISLFAIWLAERPPNRLLLFGWHRAEVIGALISLLTIWLVTGILVYLAVLRVIDLNFEIDALIMMISAGIGVAVNVLMVFVLHHSHKRRDEWVTESFTSTESRTSSVVQRRRSHSGNINVRAALIHVLGDTIQSVGVLIAAVVIYFKEDWKIVDPITTFLFSVLVLATTYHLLKDILIVLMEGSLEGSTHLNRVVRSLLAIDGVVGIHNIRIWALSLDKNALAVHLVINPKHDPNEVLRVATRIVQKKFRFYEHTIQVEPYKPDMKNCIQCQQ